jgi:uncharacterized membrane protein
MIATAPPLAALVFENVEHPWIWIVLVVAGIGILFATYWAMFQRSERGPLVTSLMFLRGAGLLALVLALAKPTWTRDTELVDSGHLAVVVDNSLSMSLADPGGKSRYALAREAVDKLRTALRADPARSAIEVDLFDIHGTSLNGQLPEQPRVERTDLVRALTEARAHLRSKPLAGMVLLSDGMDNTGRHDFHELADSPVPIFTVGFRPDPESSRLDLAVKRVQAPERVLVHNEIRVDVLVSKTAGPETQATVTIKRGREEFASQPVTFGPGDGEQKVSLKFTPGQAGHFVFTASVASETGERLLANNSMHFPLRVDAEPIRVFYVEGFLRYEYKFLKSRFEDDPDISLVSVVRQVNPEAVQNRSDGDLITPERLKNFDVVILGDMEASYLSEMEYQALVHWIEQGHALLVLGGYHSFGPNGFRATPLADVLPVVFADKEPSQSEEPFVLKLTEEGQRHPIFDVSSAQGREMALWNAAPALKGSSLVQRAKPAATVLAVNPTVQVEGKPAVVVAIQRYGTGQAMILAADTTWLWSRLTRVAGQSDTLYARFWSQTMRWLSGRSREEKRPLLTINTDRPDYEVGKPVSIRVVRQPPPGTDLSAAEMAVDVVPETGKAVSVPVRTSSRDPNVFTGTFYPSAGGRYEVAANMTAAGKPVANQTTEFLVQGSDLELADTRTNRDDLKSIASATGGLYFDIEDAAKLSDKIEPKERRIVQTRRTEYWNSPLMFGFFLCAVTVEWLIRRRNHLV